MGVPRHHPVGTAQCMENLPSQPQYRARYGAVGAQVLEFCPLFHLSPTREPHFQI